MTDRRRRFCTTYEITDLIEWCYDYIGLVGTVYS